MVALAIGLDTYISIIPEKEDMDTRRFVEEYGARTDCITAPSSRLDRESIPILRFQDGDGVHENCHGRLASWI